MRKTAWMLAGAISLASVSVAAAQDDGSVASLGRLSWPRWQGRLTLGAATTPWGLGADNRAATLSSASLMGDYYFAAPFADADAGSLGGFRATSGLIFGRRGSLSVAAAPSSLAHGSVFSVGNRLYGLAPMPHGGDAGSDAATTLPYMGFGYTGLSVRSGWSFSADLGLVAQGTGTAGRLGRALGGGQSLDDAVRDMRLAPLVQLGASYSF